MTTFDSDDLIISSLVDSKYPSLNISLTMKEAAIFFIENKICEAPVIDEKNTFLGILSSSAVMKSALDNSLNKFKVSSLCEKNINVIHMDDKITDIMPFLRPCMPVVDERDSLIGVITEESMMVELLDRLKSSNNGVDWSELCFDSSYEGFVVVDKDGTICRYNEAYSRFVGIEKEKMIGKHITEVVNDSGLPLVLKSGIPELNYIHIIRGQEMIVHRIPIWKNNKICGAIGILAYEGISELYKIFDRMSHLEDRRNTRTLLEKIREKQKIITCDQVIGRCVNIAKAKEIARRAAKTPATILITGESGVGKELFTKAIHHLSEYRHGPFVSVNCASIPENLLESELFGYDEGAFTGSKKFGKPGKFELANNGTIFLDEIGDMPLYMQAKILRVLQEREVERVGGVKAIPVNFRIIAATNKSLENLVKEKKFREDLFYRLNIISINIPPLRERKADIPLLIAHFLENISEAYRIPPKKFYEDAMVALINYHWPGNIRELVNLIEHLIVLVDGQLIRVSDLPPHITQQKSDVITDTSDFYLNEALLDHRNIIQTTKKSILEKEKAAILQALIEGEGNKTRIAKKLGISRATLYKKMAKLDLIS